jgi:hypothetical protein
MERDVRVLENHHLRVTVDSQRLWFDVLDKARGVLFSHDLWNESVGELVLTRKGKGAVGRQWTRQEEVAGFVSTFPERQVQRYRVDLSASARKTVKRLSSGQTGLEATFAGFALPDAQVEGNVTFRLVLTKDAPELQLELMDFQLGDERYNLDEVHLPVRAFPLRTSRDQGYLVFPNRQGIIYPVGAGSGFARYAGGYTWESGMAPFQSTQIPSMRWFGSVQNGSSYMALIQTPYDAAVHMIGNDKLREETPRIASLHPVWYSSHQGLGYPRRVLYRFGQEVGYVQMCRSFRRYATENGLYKSLKQKAEELSHVEKLIGAPMVWLEAGHKAVKEGRETNPRLEGTKSISERFSDVPRKLSLLNKDLGIDRLFVVLHSWEQFGVNVKEPDQWPPNAEIGGLEEFRKIYSVQTAAEFPNYLLSFYNIFNDIYVDAPSFDLRLLNKNADGTPTLGGYWEGGHCYVTCSSQFRAIAGKFFDEYQKELDLQALYVDNFNSLRECYDPDHPQTRLQCLQAKIDFLQHIVNERRWVVGTEVHQLVDWMVPHIHYCNGMVGAWGWVARPSGTTVSSTDMNEGCVLAPLWDLVYHDATVNYEWNWNSGRYRTGYLFNKPYTWEEFVLQDILCANPSGWGQSPGFRKEPFEFWGPIWKRILPLLSKLSRSLGHERMTNHEYLSEDYYVQMSEWSDGTQIYVNFSDADYQKDSIHVPPRGFYIRGAPVGELQGRLESRLVIE